MPSAIVILDTKQIVDWASFHSHCAEAFGFPEFYGNNMNAWIDCLTYLPEGDGMSAFVLGEDGRLFVNVLDYVAFSKRAPEISRALLECTAFVNDRYLEVGDVPRLVLVLR